MMTLLRHLGDGALPRQVEIWKLKCSFPDVSLSHPPCQKRSRLLSGTSSVLLDSMMTLWRHLGYRALPRQVEIWKLIFSFPDVSLRHPPFQKPSRLLSGTSSVLLDSMMTLWRHLGDGALPRQVEIWKLIFSFPGTTGPTACTILYGLAQPYTTLYNSVQPYRTLYKLVQPMYKLVQPMYNLVHPCTTLLKL